MITTNKSSQQAVILTGKELKNANYSLPLPFTLELAENQELHVTEVIRFVPGKRLVVFARWQGKSVVAKLFLDFSNGKRHMDKDVAGINILIKNKIPTAQINHITNSKDKNVHVLILERIFAAENFENIWLNKKSLPEIMPQLKAITLEIATQHVLGIKQRDLHFKNFLLLDKTIYTLDGAEIDAENALLTKKVSLENLALFLSQLGVGVEKYQEELFKFYAHSRGWLIKPRDIKQLFILIKNWNAKRWEQYSKKIYRECSAFACVKNNKISAMLRRDYLSDDFMKFLNDPDAIFNYSDTEILKAGRSTTVIKAWINNREVVIKRYNIKNIWHRLRRVLRKTRAFTSWRLAQKLYLFGVATAKPIAFVECHCLGLRGKSYYITEYISGKHAGVSLLNAAQNQAQKIARISELLKNIHQLNISHGDLKITNVLMNQYDYPVLIDLDGAKEHRTYSSFTSAWKKDVKRFLRNFDDEPHLNDEFRACLNK